jgi:hypothetical protein
MKWAALETEVSPSNFTLAAKDAAKDIVCCRRVQPAAKLKLERLTLAAFAVKAQNGQRSKLRSVLQISLLRRKTSFAIAEFSPPQN